MDTSMKRRHLSLGLLGAVAAPHLARAQLQTLALKLDWSLYGTHCVFYAGIARGLYKAEGLDLSISEGNSSGNVVRLVAAGTDPLAFIDLGTMAIGASNGMPVRGVFGIHQKNPMVMISAAANPVRTPKEMEGRVVAMAPSESTAQMFPALLARNGVEASKISVLNPAIGAKNALLMQGRADVVTGVTYFALPLFARNNFAASHFAYADFGVSALESGIVVNRGWAEQNEDRIRRFLAGTARAFAAARQDPAGAIDAALTLRTDRARDRDLLLHQLRLSLELTASPAEPSAPFGVMAERDWQAMIATMTETNMIRQALPLEQYFTNAYAPR
jgi:NitT/TauT family transport system substrate-binding protein